MKMSPKLILFAFISVICSWDYAIGGPTIQPAQNLDAKEQAKTLYKAVKGMGTSESKINEVLCKIPYSQREMIAEAFKQDYKQGLQDRLATETSGDLKELYINLMESRGELLARDLHYFITGKHKNGAISEILCATNAEEKKELYDFYKKTYNKEAMTHIKEIVVRNNDYLKVLEQCSKLQCNDKNMTDRKVLKTAQDLQAIDSKTNQAAFMAALEGLYGNNDNCIPDLQRVFVQYRSICNKGIDDAVKEALKGKGAILRAWLTLVKSTENRSAYYADMIQYAVNGVGTDEHFVYRIILQTCEQDLGDINSEYNRIYKETIFKRLQSDFKGDTEECLKMLLGA